MSAPIVAVIAFDGISPFHLTVPCLVFGEDRTALGVPRFDFRVCALEPGPLRTEVGLTLFASHDLEDVLDADIVIVPSWRNIEERPPTALLAVLQAVHARGGLVVGLCLGAFAVAAAGLLDGREATTHWADAERLGTLYPAVTVRPHRLYVDNGDVITSAGVAAGLDCCLHILRQRCGAEVARLVARRIVLSPHRQGGQAQFIERPVANAPALDGFDRALNEVRASLNLPHALDDVAARAHLTRRTFSRHFKRSTGTSFGKWLIDQRVALAQQLLETSELTIDDIAYRAGFGTATSLRQHFAAQLKTSPTRYRREFAGASVA